MRTLFTGIDALLSDEQAKCFRVEQSKEKFGTLRLYVSFYRLNRTQAGTLRARDALADHERSRNWLERELAKPFAGDTVVVTHHGPHLRNGEVWLTLLSAISAVGRAT